MLSKEDYKIISTLEYTVAIFGSFFALSIGLYLLNKYWHSKWIYPLKPSFITLYILPLIGSFIFGLIDGISFFIFDSAFEDPLNNVISSIPITSIILGAVSAMFALFIGHNISDIIGKMFVTDLHTGPFMEIIGIALGVSVVIAGYYIHLKIHNKSVDVHSERI